MTEPADNRPEKIVNKTVKDENIPTLGTFVAVEEKTVKTSFILRCVIVITFILAVCGAGGVSFLVWQSMQAEQTANQTLNLTIAQIDKLTLEKTALENTVAHLQTQQGLLSEQYVELTTQQSRTHQLVESGLSDSDTLKRQIGFNARQINALAGASRKDWQLAEAEYLLRLANQRVQLEKDNAGALLLLKQTDALLFQIDDAAIADVRATIATEISTLAMIKSIDKYGIYFKLDAMISQLEMLEWKPVYHIREDEQQPEAVESNIDTSTWTGQLQSYFDQALTKVKPYVQIRHDDKVMLAPLSPQSMYYLKTNLRLMLEQAQLALLQQKASLYQRSLEKAQDWISAYRAQTDKDISTFMLTTLNELRQTNIEPQLPDISQSLQLFKQYVDTLHRRGLSEYTAPVNADIKEDTKEDPLVLPESSLMAPASSSTVQSNKE